MSVSFSIFDRLSRLEWQEFKHSFGYYFNPDEKFDAKLVYLSKIGIHLAQ